MHRSVSRGVATPSAAAILLVATLVGGCALGRPAGASVAGPSGSANPSTASSLAVGLPVGSQPSVATSPGTSPDEPPAAWLAVDGGDSVEGQLGSFTWHGRGSDAPWLDGSPIHVGAGERLTLTVLAAPAVANWIASRVNPGSRDGSNAVGMAQGSGEPVAFDTPPRGRWSVNVDVWFSDGGGSASYYWLVDVE